MQANLTCQRNNFLRITMIKQAVNHLLLTFFCFAFLLQQVYAFTFPQDVHIESGKGSIIRTAELSVHSPFVSLFPACSAMILEDMEVVEDEDIQSSLPASINATLQKSAAEELFYDRILRNRYQQLESSAQRQAAVPFFILHHSWKSFLS